MSFDRLTLDGYVQQIHARLSGRRIEKVRPHGKSALRLDLSSRDLLFIDVSRSLAGCFLVGRTHRVPADAREVEGPSRSSALLFRKHLEGARIDGLETSGPRVLSLRTSRGGVLVRLYGSPGASLILDNPAPGATTTTVAHFGAGERVSEDEARPGAPMVYDLARALDLVREVSALSGAERRAILGERDPGLLPLLRRWPVSEPAQRRLAELLTGQSGPAPFLTPVPGDDASNSQTPPTLVPFEPDGDATRETDFLAAASRLYENLRRADLFRERMQARISRAKSEVARLTRLKAALGRDKGRWPDPAELRRHAEALLAAPPEEAGRSLLPTPGPAPGGRDTITISVPDPRTVGTMEVRVDPRLTWPQNANALYERARNIERRQNAFEERWTATIVGHEEAETCLRSAGGVRRLEDLEPDEVNQGGAPAAPSTRSRYLTSRGLEIVFGRSASQNHDVTFKVAKREDIWFHVLDAPGGHVVLRNREGRANREDIAEAASLAAFLSERRTEASVDVQYTERKHVHPAGGGRGRVRVTHAEVIRVTPQDPAGRLRAR